MSDNIFGNNVKYLRKSNGMTQKEIGQKVNYSEEGVRMWETRGSQPKELTLVSDLANLFGVSCDELIKEDLEKKYGNLVSKLGNEKPDLWDQGPSIGDTEYGKKRYAETYEGLAIQCFKFGTDDNDFMLGLYFLYGAYLNGKEEVDILPQANEMLNRAINNGDYDLYEAMKRFIENFVGEKCGYYNYTEDYVN